MKSFKKKQSVSTCTGFRIKIWYGN